MPYIYVIKKYNVYLRHTKLKNHEKDLQYYDPGYSYDRIDPC
jgi:hypothetical protein